MTYSRRTIVTLLSAASCFQLAAGSSQYFSDFLKDKENIRRLRGLSDIRSITTIDGCESTNYYSIWLYAGSGHISLIGEPIVDKNKEDYAAPSSSNEDDEDPNNGLSVNAASCPMLFFDDGGENLDKAIYEVIDVLPEDDTSNGKQGQASTASSSNREAHNTAWNKDAMRLHKNHDKATSSFVLSEVIEAYDHAMHRQGAYDIFNNNCATFVLNMMAELGIEVDDGIIKYTASQLYSNHTVIEPVLQNQSFMDDLFLNNDEDNDASNTTTSSHKKNTGLLRGRNRHQAQAAAEMVVADSLEGAELFVAHYVKEWSANRRRLVDFENAAKVVLSK